MLVVEVVLLTYLEQEVQVDLVEVEMGNKKVLQLLDQLVQQILVEVVEVVLI